MSVYLPRAFASADIAATQALMREYPFATLVTPVDPEPLVSHIPLLHIPEGARYGTLLGHVARANPHWQALPRGSSLAIFHGPHAYVSPSWYAAPAQAVPTWNYAVVHARVTAEILERDTEIHALIQLMVDRFESARPNPWRLDTGSASFKSIIGAIVAFRLSVEHLDTKLKLSQNRASGDRDRVSAALRDEAHAEAAATADWMSRFGPQD